MSLSAVPGGHEVTPSPPCWGSSDPWAPMVAAKCPHGTVTSPPLWEPVLSGRQPGVWGPQSSLHLQPLFITCCCRWPDLRL